jgi:hypothetical protein
MRDLMLLLQCRHTLEDHHVACSCSSRWSGLTIGNERTSADASLPYRPYYLSYPSLYFCGLYWLYQHFHQDCHHFLQHQSFRCKPTLSLGCSVCLAELGDDLIGHGGCCCIFVHQELLEDFPLIVLWNPAKQTEGVHYLTHLRDCHSTVHVGSISISGWCPDTEIVIVNLPIHPWCAVSDISAV